MFRMFFVYPVLAVCALLLIWGCGREQEQQPLSPAQVPATPAPDYVVAMVNGTPLRWEDMDRRATGFLKDEQKTNHLIIPDSRMEEAKEHFRKRAIQAFVFKTLMLEQATKSKIKVLPKDKVQGLERLAVSLKSRNWTTNEFFNNGPMPSAVMHKEFEESLIIDKYIATTINKNLSLGKDDVNNMINSINATNELKRAQIEDIRQQLLDGASFEELAAKYSVCPKSAKKGGDLGEFARGKMDKTFEDAAFSQEVGEIGPVIRTPYGYHIIKVSSHASKKEATDSTPEIPESVRASHILIQLLPVDKRRVTDTLKKRLFEENSKKLYRELLGQADVKCFLYSDIQF
ncbi:MAG: peptidylprolyl isomerase [Kiritimatiellae bacterium]|nr:peptidylprolyl isomerase [Kiritimatiellia bacterium]